MNAVFTVLTVLIILAAILLIVVVLLQNGKGEGLASNFVAGNQTFGVRQTADMLEKMTWGIVTFILVASIVSSFALGTKDKGNTLNEKIVATEAAAGDLASPMEDFTGEAPAAQE